MLQTYTSKIQFVGSNDVQLSALWGKKTGALFLVSFTEFTIFARYYVLLVCCLSATEHFWLHVLPNKQCLYRVTPTAWLVA